MEQQCDMGECLKPANNTGYVAVAETGKSEVTFKFRRYVNKKTEVIVDTNDIKMEDTDIVLKNKKVEREVEQKLKKILEKFAVKSNMEPNRLLKEKAEKPIEDTENKPLIDRKTRKRKWGKKWGKKKGKGRRRGKGKKIRNKCKKGQGCNG